MYDKQKKKVHSRTKSSSGTRNVKRRKIGSQPVSEHGIHTNVLNWWKAEAVQNLSEQFVDDRNGITKKKKDYEKHIDGFYAEVG
ncbi:hypothetical protein [Paenibacillus periandrae]|uniref:hypothetical protein n=1 Tax=Paenibacillus periandrae TaxID=1761741 RepID=UPI001F08B543|nr:hypothetical protein [Paenibacillus periandrae]